MIIQSKNVWVNGQFQPMQIELKKQIIQNLWNYNEKKADLDVGEHWVLPGLIDVHCHGYAGCNANTATLDGLKNWNDHLPLEGVTSYLITTSTAPWEDLRTSFPIIDSFIKSNPQASDPLGIHIEGPFLNPQWRGAQSLEHIVKPNVEKLKELEALAIDQVKMVAIAVEEDDQGAMSKYCVNRGIVVAVGHSGATFDQVKEAIGWGVSNFTHTFNGMTGLHHREPGVAGAAMRFKDAYAEIIGDGVHVHYDVVHLLGELKGEDKLVLITDAVAIKGLAPGVYETKERWCVVGEDGVGRLKDGRLAGSSNKMNDMVRNLMVNTDLSLKTIIQSATINPARMLNLNHKGSLEVGKDADIIIVNENIDVLQTYSRGECVYENKELAWK